MADITFEQLSFFSGKSNLNYNNQKSSRMNTASTISSHILNSFDTLHIPFIGCDFDCLYPELEQIIPGEAVKFAFDSIDTLIACETICSAICYQINWDYLRKAVLKKTLGQPDWLSPEKLSYISETEVDNMLTDYHKPERIRADERAAILRCVGVLAKKHDGFAGIFLDPIGGILSESQIRGNLLECTVFSQDPEGKKLELLLQKLSNIPTLSKLSRFSKPAVDYHLIRCFLRRGLIFPKTKSASQFVSSTESQRKESTMGAIRQLCSSIILEISNFTGLSINSINQIEWHVGRSVCKECQPDCYLEGIDTIWIRKKYDKCPFHTTCCALNYNPKLLHINEPNYAGTSY